MAHTPFRRLDAARALEHIVMQLAAARRTGDPASIPTVFTEGDFGNVEILPDWVGRAGFLRSRGAWWLWCEPRKGTRAGSGQFVMNVPDGRYMVDILDTRVHAWFSRESAAGAPLVAGLPATGHPVLVRIRRVSASTARPRD